MFGTCVKKQKYAITQPTPHSFALGVIPDLNFLLENGIFYMKYTTKNTIITDINCIHFSQRAIQYNAGPEP